VENLVPFNASALEFISNMSQKIINRSGDDKETQFFILAYFCDNLTF